MKISLKQKYIFLSVIAMLFTECSQTEEDMLNGASGVCFTASIGQNQTRATEDSFETNDEISVFAFKGETGFSGEEYAHNRKYTLQSQLFTADEENTIKQPTDDSQLSYVAVYPYSTATDAKFSFQVKEDQSAGSNYTQSDLMMASTYPTDAQAPTLMFSHCLSSIVVNLSFAKAPAGNVSVKMVNVSTTVSADLATATFSSSGEANQSVVTAFNGTNSYKAVLPPQTTSMGSTGIEITVGDAAPLSYKFPASCEWKSGIRYAYTLYIAEDGTVSDVKPGTPENPITKRVKKTAFEILESDVQNGAIYDFTLPYQSEFNYDEEGRLSKMIMDITDEEGIHISDIESLTYSKTSIKIIEEVAGSNGYIYQITCNLDENNRITQLVKQYEEDYTHTLQYSYADRYPTQITFTCSEYPEENWIQNNKWENERIINYEVLDQTTMESLESATLKYHANSNSYKYPVSTLPLYEAESMSLAYLPESYFGTKVNVFPIETIIYDTKSRHTYRSTCTIEADEDNYVTKIIDTSIETDEKGNVIGREVGSMTFVYETVVTN